METQSRRSTLWHEAEAMLDAARVEERDFTSDEQDRWSVLMDEIDAIDAASRRAAQPRPEWARNIHSTGEQRMENRIEEATVPTLPTLKELRAPFRGYCGSGWIPGPARTGAGDPFLPAQAQRVLGAASSHLPIGNRRAGDSEARKFGHGLDGG